MNFEIKEALSLDDVLLVPQYSTIESRSHVNTSVKMGPFTYSHPIIPANMKTIIGLEMAKEICWNGGLAILHRFMPIEEQLKIAKIILLKEYCGAGVQNLAVSVGVKSEDVENISKFMEIGVRIFCIDIAHGDSKLCIDMIRAIKQLGEGNFVIAGNVATGDGARRLWEAGADVVKVNIGAGSSCTTRVVTANGVPQLTALIEVAAVKQELTEREIAKHSNPLERKQFYCIADGGCKNSGDLVKSLCFADMVMTGSLFAGCDESPGETIVQDGKTYKSYVGSSTHKTNHIEGVEALVPIKGKYKDILTKLLEGLRSGMAYQNASTLEELRDNPQFVKITHAGLIESRPHINGIIK